MNTLLPILLAALATVVQPVLAPAVGGASVPIPVLSVTGTCPGPMTLTVTGATPGGLVVLLYGVPGTFTYGGTPCTGITLNVINPNGTPPTVGTMQPANSAGVLIVNFNATPNVCGFTVQAVDVATCTTSNTITL
jgi:hypothetical protein